MGFYALYSFHMLKIFPDSVAVGISVGDPQIVSRSGYSDIEMPQFLSNSGVSDLVESRNTLSRIAEQIENDSPVRRTGCGI